MLLREKIKGCFFDPRTKLILNLLLFGILLGFCVHAFADGNDVLAGTTGDATSTLQGSGKKWIYIAEGVVALGTYIKTRNFFALGGVAIVAVFVNILLKLAGN